MPSVSDEGQSKTLPPPWDRIFSLGTRLFVWGLLLAVLYLLRPFLLLIFLTFVFSYIQAHGVDGLRHRIASRPRRVTIVGLVFLGTILASGWTLFPQIEDEAGKFITHLPQYIKQADSAVEKFLREHPSVARAVGRDELIPKPAVSSEPKQQGGTTEPKFQGTGEQNPPELIGPPAPPELVDGQAPAARPSMVTNLFYQVLGFGENASRDPKELVAAALAWLTEAFSKVLTAVSAFLLSLLFSFLIVLDLPKLTSQIQGLKNTKVGFIYDEVADNVYMFGKVLGRALEAQFFVACVNTLLTGIGLYFMGLPNLVFLCAIVFLCSFIPVAGVFISSAPICLMALQMSGFSLFLLSIGLILLIHTIEAYILNPKIFGHHLRMNPVLVLIVLTVAAKLFGVWGLVLGLPVVNYFFRYAIRHERGRDMDPANSAAA